MRKWLVISRVADKLLVILRVASPYAPRFGPPKGTFSAHEKLQHQGLLGEILLERQDVAPIPADSMRIVSGLKQDRHQPWPIFWTLHRSARLVGPSLVQIDEGKHACLEAMYVEHHRMDPTYRSIWLPRPQALRGNWTSVISLWTRVPNYYHWFTDALPRLAVLDRFPADTRILVPANLRPYQRDSLRLIGLADRCRETSERHLTVESYFFSAPTAMTGCTNPYGVEFLRRSFLPHADASFQGPTKVYLRRRGKTRGVINEEEVEAFLWQRGWVTMDPEILTLAQQIKLFAGADALCGVHGAAFTNVLWCKPGCRVIELMADNYLNGCYESISACVGAQYQYEVFPGDDQFRMLVDLERLARIPK